MLTGSKWLLIENHKPKGSSKCGLHEGKIISPILSKCTHTNLLTRTEWSFPTSQPYRETLSPFSTSTRAQSGCEHYRRGMTKFGTADAYLALISVPTLLAWLGLSIWWTSIWPRSVLSKCFVFEIKSSCSILRTNVIASSDDVKGIVSESTGQWDCIL